MYFLRARYYSPTFQRFTSEDPIGFAGSGVNLYAYVGNGPTNFADRLGLEREDGVVASHTTSPSHCSCSRSRLPRTTAADFMWIS